MIYQYFIENNCYLVDYKNSICFLKIWMIVLYQFNIYAFSFYLLVLNTYNHILNQHLQLIPYHFIFKYY